VYYYSYVKENKMFIKINDKPVKIITMTLGNDIYDVSNLTPNRKNPQNFILNKSKRI
jgi:hypothetical protein